MSRFTDRLREAQQATGSVLCVGLDPDWRRLPAAATAARSVPDAVMAFNAAIIEATAPNACAYKMNFAFYEALGRRGYEVLADALRHVPARAVTIGDAKRGDIGNTARHYAEAIFDGLGFDACTVAPYMGRDAVAPFLRYGDKGTFVLARTSNASARDFQEIPVGSGHLFHHVARKVGEWDRALPGTAGLVVGATAPGALKELRTLCPALPFLIPGLGAQGGQADDIAAAASGPVIVNSSRGILFASSGNDFAERAEAEARRMQTLLAGYVPR